MADLGYPHLAATLAGALPALTPLATPIPPLEQSQRDTKLAVARRQLGGAAFDVDFHHGATMGLDAVSAYLLAQISHLENEPARPADQ
jgi:hypothetical protein